MGVTDLWWWNVWILRVLDQLIHVLHYTRCSVCGTKWMERITGRHWRTSLFIWGQVSRDVPIITGLQRGTTGVWAFWVVYPRDLIIKTENNSVSATRHTTRYVKEHTSLPPSFSPLVVIRRFQFYLFLLVLVENRLSLQRSVVWRDSPS